MKLLSVLLTMLLLSAVFLNGGEAWPASPPSQGATSGITQTLQEADSAFSHSNFTLATEILRRLLTQAPSSSELWMKYNRAVLAKAGNDYLQSVPKDRYRIESLCLMADLERGSNDYFLLDVRQPEEFAQGHLAGAVNIPLRQVLDHLNQLPKPQSGKILLIICRSQHRANHVLVILRELGYTNAFTLRGGYTAYRSLSRFSSKSRKTDGSCSRKAHREPDTGKDGNTAAMPGKIVSQLSEAERSFAVNDFDQAVHRLQQALIQAPQYNELWRKYDQAILARAGKEYLQHLPEDRYRISAAVFGKKYLKGPGLGGFFLLDVRDRNEFVVSHIAGSINVPFRRLLSKIAILPQTDSGKTLLIICRSQYRAIHTLVILRELGYSNTYTLQGGYKAYRTWLKSLEPVPKQNDKGKHPVVPDNGQEEDFGC